MMMIVDIAECSKDFGTFNQDLEKIGEAKIIRTAGLDFVRIKHSKQQYIDCVQKYYESIANERA